MALSVINRNPSFLDGPRYLHHLLSKHWNSESIAIEYHGPNGQSSSLTYKQLDSRSDHLAAKLLQLRQGQPRTNFIVPLFIPQSIELYTSQVAILKAGGAFCPIPLDVPEDRLRFILDDVEASILLTVENMAQQLPRIDGVHVMCVNDVRNAPSKTLQVLESLSLDPSQPAYVMYTSGSTGKPKGVIISHSAASQALLAHDRHIPDFFRFLQFANPTFDVSVFEIFFPLFRGRTLVSCERRQLLNDLPGVINRLNIDAAELTPSVASSLLHDRASVPCLKVLLTIGEMLKKSVIEQFGGDSDRVAILHGMYGPTEATIHCTLQPSFQTDMSVGNIGIPLDTTSAFIVRPATQEDPYGPPEILLQGEEGELAVGGYQLADGYINRSEQTRAAFVHHPEHGRLYRTGDRARLRPDGTFECMGRISSGQVKLRGQRIELGEIEHAANQAKDVRTVVADVIDRVLVAFCVLSNPAVTTSDIRRSCQKWLPAFMVPNDIVILNSLPYLASGKVDRRALQTQYAEIKQGASEKAGLSLKSQTIAEAACSVLGTAINGTTSLPAAGLDSLSAIRLASSLKRSGFALLDAATLLDAQTIGDVEKILAHASEESDALEDDSFMESVLGDERLAQDKEAIESIYPCTPAQTAMLAETGRSPQAYCNWVKLKVELDTSVQQVENALILLAIHHELLRTGFLALSRSQTHSHANVVFQPSTTFSVRTVSDFTYDFSLEMEQDFLRPCQVQLRKVTDGVEILLQLHHSLYDQWAMDIFRRDLAALLRGEELPHLASFKAVSNYHTTRSDTENSIDFWQDQLRDAVPSPFPQLNGRKVPGKIGRTPWTTWDFDPTAARHEARQHGYSAPALFQAAFAYCLSLYVGSQDVLFGTVFSGRNIPVPDVDGIFGPLLVTLPLRVDLSTVQTISDLLRTTHESNRSIQRHSQLSLASIKEAAQCSPGLALFDSLFVWQETSISNSQHLEKVKEIDSADYTEFNLVLEFEPRDGAIATRVTYQERLLPVEHVDLLLEQIVNVARFMLERPDASLQQLRSRILSQSTMSICNPDPSNCAPSCGVVGEIETHAALHPDAKAIEFASGIESDFDSRSITFSELNCRANRVAHHLIKRGARPDDLVAVWVNKSLTMYVAMLGILKAGAGYLPLVPETPLARIQSVFDQANIKMCICDSNTHSALNKFSKVKALLLDGADLSRESHDNPNVQYVPANVAYAVFTSGSTGKPKGVAVTFGNLSGNLASLAELYKVNVGDRLLQACSQAFDVSVFEIFFAFSTGMCLCSARKDVLFRDLEHSINVFQITHLSMTPTVAALVDPNNVPTVRFLITAGEPLSKLVQTKWSGRGLHQGYGPSETTNICSVHMDFPRQNLLGDLGPPLRNTSVFVLSTDAHLTVLPKGALGELAFGGEQVFRGYIGREDLNATKLVDHPKYGRLYRSGDMARMLHNGSMFFCGRQDDQVKIRGNRIELGEITALVQSDAKVKDCTTVVYDIDASGQSLVVFFVPSDSVATADSTLASMDGARIRDLFQRLQGSLPVYMIPNMLVPITVMPLTTQGKLDRRRLREVFDSLSSDHRNTFSQDSELATEEAQEWSEDERTIAFALAETLDISAGNIKKTTSFYAFGLNSLNAIRLSKLIETRAQKLISVNDIFQNPSVKRLARAYRKEQPSSSVDASKPVAEVFSQQIKDSIRDALAANGDELEAILPCTPLQDAMLAASQSSWAGAYSNSTTFQINGDLNKIEAAWKALQSRHAILRTHFVQTELPKNPFAQVILKEKTLPWANAPPEQSKDAPTTMDNPFYILAYSVDSTQYIELRMHHAIYDGISMSTLLDEAQRLYMSEHLPPAISVDSFLAECVVQQSQRSLDFWSDKLSSFHPTPFPKPKAPSPVVERTYHAMLQVSAESFDAFCKRHSVTSLSIFQAAWAKTLASLQGTEDLCFGNVVSGRSVPMEGIDRLVAPCFNTIPVRARIFAAKTNLGLIRQLHQQNLDSLHHQLTALRRIQGLSKSPEQHLFDSMLLIQPPASALNSSIWSLENDTGSMELPLVIEVVPQSSRFAPQSSSFAIRTHHIDPRVPSPLAEALTDAFIAAVGSCLQYSSSGTHDFLSFEKDTIAGQLQVVAERETDSRDYGPNSNSSRPWNDIEQAVREVFAGLADIAADKIFLNTSMYRIGLDSLNAAQIASKLRRRGIFIDAADVVRDPTPQSIAGSVRSAHSEDKFDYETTDSIDFAAFDRAHRSRANESARVDLHSIEVVRPCTAVQCGMIAQSLDSNGTLYVNHVEFKIPKQTGIDDVRKAWSIVQQKHQVLRLGFIHIGGIDPFAMVVYKPEPSSIPVVDQEVDEAAEKADRQISADIVRHIHSPAWRLRTTMTDTASAMTISIHHALYDADSLQLLLHDFHAVLLHDKIGPPTDMDQLLASQLQAANAAPARAKAFWSKQLKSSNFVKFPNLTPSVVKDGRMQSVSVKSSIGSDRLLSCCKEQGVTVQSLGQAAWAKLLSAYTGEAQVLFGTVLSSRLSPEDSRVAFPSITTIPVSCDAGLAKHDLVQRMRDYNASAQKYRSTPLTDIQRYAGRVGQPLFDSVFVYQKTSTAAFGWDLVRETAAVDYAVSLELEILPDQTVSLRLTFNDGFVPQEHARLMLQQYDHLMSRLLFVDQAHGESSQTLYAATPAKEHKLPSEVKLLHEFLEIGANRHPDKIALEFIDQLQGSKVVSRKWSYKQADERSNQVAHLLRHHGVKQSDIVAVCMEKSPEVAFAFEGILKAGCSYLAMDPELPPARHKFILEDSSATLVFVSPGRSMVAAEPSVPIIELTESKLHGLSTEKIHLAAIDPSVATSYNLYTSGTTGTPKGCELSHENALQFLVWFQRLFSGHWDENSRWLQFASYWFDVSMLEHFWSWGVGITCVGAPRDVVLEDLAHFIRTANITHIDLTPSLARMLHPDDVPSMVGHVFITGGEALKQEIIDAWGPVRTICNGYGPTETSCGVTMLPFVGPDAKPSNIGPQFDNVGTYVLEPDTERVVLRGAVGELCIAGVLVGKGYLNRPELTAKAFPTLQATGEKIYRTGDLVRILHDGSFSFIGRKDTQAKLRGQRLEIGEIDNVIQSSSKDIVEVMSLVAKSEDGGKETLVAFISTGVGRKDKQMVLEQSALARELVRLADEACREALPPYMVPTHTVPIPFMPLTVNNKVDSKKLVALFNSLSIKNLQELKGDGTDAEPLQPVEQRVAQAVGEMLEVSVELIDRTSNVFSLGLSSVSAISLASLLKKSGFSAASVNIILKNPTIGGLSKKLSDQGNDEGIEIGAVQQANMSISAFSQRWKRVVADKLGVTSADVSAVAPCTPLQEGMILDSLRIGSRPYFNEFHYLLGEVDISRVKAALSTLMKAVEMLRTAFVQTDDGFAQVVSKKVSLPLSEVSGNKAIEERKIEWLDASSEDLTQPWQVAIASTAEGTLLVFHVHHAIYDGISWELLLNHLAEAYQSNDQTLKVGRRFMDVLPHGPLMTQPNAKSFWQDLFAGSFNGHIAQEQQLGYDNGTRSSSLTIQDTSGFEAARKRLGVSHQSLLQACFEVALHQLSPSTTMYGHVVSGRSIPFDGADCVLGPLFNTIPVPVAIEEKQSWSELVNRSQAQNSALLAFQHTPLRNIRKWLSVDPSDQLFDALFVFQHEASPSSAQRHMLWKVVEQPAIAGYPLAFEVSLQDDGRLAVNAVAQSGIVGEQALDQLLQDFASALGTLQEDHERQVSAAFTIHAQVTNSNEKQRKTTVPYLNGVHQFEWNDEGNKIRKAIAELANLNEAEVDEHSSIFSLGLDSIDAVRLVSRLKKADLAIPVSKIIQAQTIPRILSLVETSSGSKTNGRGSSQLATLEKKLTRYLRGSEVDITDVERVLPATPNQEALIADMIRSDFADYYNHDVLRLKEGVSTSRLIDAWQTVIDNSAILRTGFVEVADPEIDVTFAQLVHAPATLQIRSFSATSVEDIADIQRQITESVRKTARLGESPLRLALTELDAKQYLIISISHAQYDGHSLALIHEDVLRAYGGTYSERPSYDSTIEDALSSTSEDARRFWDGMLFDAKPSMFPTHGGKSSGNTIQRDEIVSALTADRARGLCKKIGCSLQALAQTAWSMVLAHYTRSVEVSFGSVLACRDSEEAEQVMFPTMNTVAMRLVLHGTRTEMLRHTQSLINEMLSFQRTPLRTIQTAAHASDLFNTLFIYQHRPETQDDESETLYESVQGSSSVEFTVASELEAVGNKIILRTACKASALDAVGAREMLNRLDLVLASMVNDSEGESVTISSAGTSICGLPQWQERKESLTTGFHHDEPAEDAQDDLTPMALSIRSALAQVAKLPENSISPTATIESIGIDSISIIKVVALLRKDGLSPSVSQLLHARTLTKMAQIIGLTSRQANDHSEPSTMDIINNFVEENDLRAAVQAMDIDIDTVDRILPATAGQTYMINVWKRTKGQLFYPTFDFRVSRAVDVKSIERAWFTLVCQHDVLRTVFCSTKNKEFPLIQIILKNAPSSFLFGDSPLPGTTQPMVFLRAVQNSDNLSLKLTIHHALYDAVSLPLLAEGLQRLLVQEQLTPSKMTQEDFLVLSVTPDAREQSKTFWSRYLGGVNQQRLRQPQHEGPQKRVEIFIPALSTTSKQIEDYAKQQAIALHSLLFAAHAKVYSHLAQSEGKDVVLGVYLSNRTHLDHLSDLSFPTLNLLPLVVRSIEKTSLIEIARQIQSDLNEIGTAERSAASLAQIFEWTSVQVDTFVNLIKTPETEGRVRDGGSVLEEIGEEMGRGFSRVVEPGEDAGMFEVPAELGIGHEREVAYKYSLDIEATISNGQLDVGVFCPEQMLGLEKAKGSMQELKELLEGVVG